MADVFTKAKRSQVMAAIGSSGNRSTEAALKRLLRTARLGGWRSNVETILGTPDIVFREVRVALFADGCFWHGCTACGLRDRASTNRKFWLSKITRNINRDRAVSRALRKDGWHVLRIWEHDLEKRPEMCLARIRRLMERAQELADVSLDPA